MRSDGRTGIELVAVSNPVETGFLEEVEGREVEVALRMIVSHVPLCWQCSSREAYRYSVNAADAELVQPLVQIFGDGDFVGHGGTAIGGVSEELWWDIGFGGCCMEILRGSAAVGGPFLILRLRSSSRYFDSVSSWRRCSAFADSDDTGTLARLSGLVSYIVLFAVMCALCSAMFARVGDRCWVMGITNDKAILAGHGSDRHGLPSSAPPESTDRHPLPAFFRLSGLNDAPHTTEEGSGPHPQKADGRFVSGVSVQIRLV